MPFHQNRLICSNCNTYFMEQVFISDRWCPLGSSNKYFEAIESECKCFFCIDCLQKLADESVYDCPTCRGDIFDLVELQNP